LVFPASGILWVSYNNGRNGFYDPLAYYRGAFPDPRFIHFAAMNRDLLTDIVMWAPGQTRPRIYLNTGVGFADPSPDAPGPTRLASEMETLHAIDLNGDGLDDLVMLNGSGVECAINTAAGLASFSPCSTQGGQFSDAQGWANYANTFATAHINGPVLTGGLPTGVIFAPVLRDPVRISDRYRFLCNQCFTNAADKTWKPELRASQIVWGDFAGTGIDSPLFVRADGLYLGLTQLAK
jgi:hypothetical protein